MNQRKQTQPDLISLTSRTPENRGGHRRNEDHSPKKIIRCPTSQVMGQNIALFKYMISSPKFNRRRAPLISARIHKIDQWGETKVQLIDSMTFKASPSKIVNPPSTINNCKESRGAELGFNLGLASFELKF